MSKQHARFAASSAERWVNCPASDHLISCAPKRLGSNRAADEGTTAHDLMDFALNANVKNVRAFFANDDRYTDEMKDAVQKYADDVRGTMDMLELEGGTPELFVEQRVEAGHLHMFDAFGTADTIILDRTLRRLFVFDLKFGRGVVTPFMNYQLMYYATAFMFQHDLELNEYEVSLNIFQPRTNDEMKTWVLGSPSYLEEFVHNASQAIEAIENNGAALKPVAGAWCKFCDAKVICPAISTKALSDAKLDFDDSPVLPDPKT